MALAGQDGKALALLMGQAKAYGVRTLSALVGGAVRRYKGTGKLLTDADMRRMADALAAVNATADLLGRTRVLERAERAEAFRGRKAPPDVAFSTFADGDGPGILATPEDAANYFANLRPELGKDPKRYGESMRRHAFTLARSANAYLTERVQGIIARKLRENRSTPEAQRAIRDALEAAGVTTTNPQYAEMVFRTNVMDAFQTGMYSQGLEEPEAFPCWCYLIVDDERTGDDHRPKGGKYFPRTATFSEVRGERVYNCRCSMRWVDRYEWESLKEGGARTERKW